MSEERANEADRVSPEALAVAQESLLESQTVHLVIRNNHNKKGSLGSTAFRSG